MFGLKESEFYLIIDILKIYSKEIEWVKIFGSRARGDFKNYSDIDLAVAFRKDIILELTDNFKESNLQFTVDVIDYKKIVNEKLKSYVDKEGKILFLTDEQGTAWEIYEKIKTEYRELFQKFSNVIDEKIIKRS
ncbi:MAG: nucleotidyltransferase domain-containing protein [Fusobacteriaceae bacterium]